MEKDYVLPSIANFNARPGPYLLIIMDGVGIGKDYEGNAFIRANTPNLDKWTKECEKNGLYTQLKAHGTAVGLPSDQDMGNSEVGHNALGSGRVYAQGAKRVIDAIETGKLFENDAWKKTVGKAAENDKAAHFIGLLSDGNVHSHIDQLFGILEGAAKEGVPKLYIHTLLDGRDVPPLSALKYIKSLNEKLEELSNEYGCTAKIASGGGRMHVTMDRYESDWEIVRRGYEAHAKGHVVEEDIDKGYPGYFKSAKEAIETGRKVFNLKEDQYHPAFVIVDEDGEPIGKMENGDAVVNFNYRGDRAIEISKAFVLEDFNPFDRGQRPNVNYVGLCLYDDEEMIPPNYLVPPLEFEDTSAQYLSATGVSTFAIAETHKFGHVTYFWNGNRTGYIDPKIELYEEIKSLPNELTEDNPAMKADVVTDRLLEIMDTNEYKYIRCNYANGDMVGHTGNIESGIKAMEVLDECLGKVVEKALSLNGLVVITADHGNCEEMLEEEGGSVTKHSCNPVPFMILDSQYQGEYKIDTSDIDTPGISNVIATFMNLLGYEHPPKFRKSLIKFTK